MDQFKLVSDYRPSGDQPAAIEALARGVDMGLREQTLFAIRTGHSAAAFPGAICPCREQHYFFTIPLNFCAILCKYTAFLPVFKGFLLFFLKMLGKISKEGLSYSVCLIT